MSTSTRENAQTRLPPHYFINHSSPSPCPCLKFGPILLSARSRRNVIRDQGVGGSNPLAPINWVSMDSARWRPAWRGAFFRVGDFVGDGRLRDPPNTAALRRA